MSAVPPFLMEMHEENNIAETGNTTIPHNLNAPFLIAVRLKIRIIAKIVFLRIGTKGKTPF